MRLKEEGFNTVFENEIIVLKTYLNIFRNEKMEGG